MVQYTVVRECTVILFLIQSKFQHHFRIWFYEPDQYEVVPGLPGFSSHSLSQSSSIYCVQKQQYFSMLAMQLFFYFLLFQWRNLKYIFIQLSQNQRDTSNKRDWKWQKGNCTYSESRCPFRPLLLHTWACQMPLDAGACCPRHRGLVGSARIHMLQDAVGGAHFHWEIYTWQPSKNMPGIHHCYLLTEQHGFQMKAKPVPHCFITYLRYFNNIGLLFFSEELKLKQKKCSE